ncbi:hypothetical protein ACFWHT_03510 [Microbacterium sp. NPDC058342]|uniref:hypothetical protein n=1 Tax=Microbacterium sp. NPDC058342 TaxID=3346454 RepID=UPI003656DD3F
MNEDAPYRPSPPGDGDAWDAGLADPFAGSVFGQEIANVSESDWDVDSALIWGEDPVDAGPVSDAAPGADDFPG